MLRRTFVSAVQRSATHYSKTAAAPQKGPLMTSARGAAGPEGDTVVDKAILGACLAATGAWWCFVDGPHNMH